MGPETEKESYMEEAMTMHEIKRHLEDENAVHWERVEELMHDTPENCVDGRSDKGVVGVPGGNAGEFLLSLASIERSTGEHIDVQRIPDIFKKYVEEFGSFYMHTDEHAAHSMEVTPDALQRPGADRALLLDKLCKAEHMGCGHLKLMAQNAEIYGVRPELIQAFVRAFYEELWSGNPQLQLEVLMGEHKEKAVLQIEIAEDTINADTEIPTVAPQHAGVQTFVYHPQVAEYMRREHAKKIAGVTGIPVDEAKYMDAIFELAPRQLAFTLEQLAKGLPVVRGKFNNDGQVAVEKIGMVSL